MIGRNGERRSGISAQAARHDDDDDDTHLGMYTLNISASVLSGLLQVPLVVLSNLPGIFRNTGVCLFEI